MPTKGRGIFEDLAVKWFQSTGLNPRQYEVLETLKTWIAAGKEHMVESDCKRL